MAGMLDEDCLTPTGQVDLVWHVAVPLRSKPA